ncbi:DNA internalization-related competence protein ComEC/Rec2 [Aquincola sp. MAHUQ-54]|uniref:DNA internalization-related competence protein ComEC/Rec2 n=1 Tax=Aquincola agrisoli TaxID=3119538 RepID=A0AAW9QN03_9BURK
MGGDTAGLRLAGLVVAWLGGVALQTSQPSLWPAAAYAAGLAAGLLGLLAASRWRRPGGWLLAVAALALLGFAWTGWRAQQVLAEALPAALEDQDLVVEGVVAGLPREVPGGTRFLFEVEAARQSGRPVAVPRRLSIGWYGGRDDGDDAGPAMPAAATDLQAGDRWRFTLRLRRPHGALNPHGFDHELWLFEQRIRATGSLRDGAVVPPQRLARAAGRPVDRLRQQVRDAIALRVGDGRTAGVLAALAVGDQAAIERADWSLFRAVGIAHLMSISGVHVTMFAWLAGGAIGVLWRRSRHALRLAAAPRAARWGGVLAAAAYALLAGWGVPAQRTVWMLATAALLASGGLHWPAPLVLLAAAAVVTVMDPWALLQPGFWLSFAAVGLLMASGSGAQADAGRQAAPVDDAAPQPLLQRLRAALRGALHTQAIATLGLAPLTLVFFQQLSPVGFVANLVAIPLVTLLITPLAVAGMLVPALWPLAAWAVQALSWAMEGLAGLQPAVFTAAAAPEWAQGCGLLGGLLMVVRLPWRIRWLAVPLVLPLLWPPVPRPAEGRFEAVAADIGQGSAVLLRTRNRLMLYDTGPQYSRERDAGERVLLPLLQARGERRIDLLVLSHRDTDHVGGAAALMAGLPVAGLLSSLEDGHPLRAGAVPHTRCAAGQGWRWDGVRFEVLHPDEAGYGRAARPNARSCVLRVEDAEGRSLLLAGDIEAAQEAALVAAMPQRLRSDVLLAPHHGSKTSSTEAFVAAVAPRTVVVQAGYRNRFGHPHPAVLSRYERHGVAVVRSDTCGAWTWRDGAMSCERATARRYWHAAVPPP